MPPPPEEKPPLPRPKPPKPKPKKNMGPEPKPMPASERYWSPGGTLPPDPIACAGSCAGTCVLLPHCSPQPPPPSPAATVHISSSRLPTPLIALSASLLAVSAVLLLALLLHRLARRRRRRRQRLAQNAAAHHDAEGGHVLAGAAAEGEEDEEVVDGGGGVHHVWYIRTKGLDERAIAAIAAVVYDAGSKKLGAGEVDDGGGSCAVCLAEFRHGETLRLLPRCGHAFHRGCIDTWLRAHINCPLCRAPVQVASLSAGAAAADSGATADAAPGGAPARNNPLGIGGGGVQVQPEEAEGGGAAERGVRRAASMVLLPRRGEWPEVSVRAAPASSSGREGDMTGIGKIMRLLKFSDSQLEMDGVIGAGAGRSISFGDGRRCQPLPARSGPSATGVSSDETAQRTGS